MIVQQIPTYKQHSYSMDVVLGEATYTFKIRWNSKGKFWVLDIYDREMGPVLYGVKLVKEYPLTKRYGLTTMPPFGDLVVVDTMRGGEEPSFDNLGTRFLLCYVDWTEEELAASENLLKSIQDGSVWDNGASIWDTLSARWAE